MRWRPRDGVWASVPSRPPDENSFVAGSPSSRPLGKLFRARSPDTQGMLLILRQAQDEETPKALTLSLSKGEGWRLSTPLVRRGARHALKLAEFEKLLAAEFEMGPDGGQRGAPDLPFQRVHAVEFGVVGAGQPDMAAAFLRQVDAFRAHDEFGMQLDIFEHVGGVAAAEAAGEIGDEAAGLVVDEFAALDFVEQMLVRLVVGE